jgi:hypothetical protein
MLMSAFALAIIGSFAFKVEKPFIVVASAFDPVEIGECDSYLPTQNGCAMNNTGARCTAYLSSTYPNLPAYSNVVPLCRYPLYLFH